MDKEFENYLVEETEQDRQQYKNSTYLLVSKIAYLIGAPEKVLTGGHVPPQMLETFEELEKNKNARIIRNLCVIRCCIERNFSKVQRAMVYDMKNIDTMPDFIPPKAAKQLWKDEIQLQKPNYKPERYILDINKLLTERIDTIKPLFPIWLNWDYIRELFLMPNGQNINAVKAAHQVYHANIGQYPYQTYINWHFGPDDGFILYNDKKFVTLLYEKHKDYFEDMSRVSDASDITKFGIYDFIEASKKGVVLVVDCENSDPYKLYATLKNLDAEQIREPLIKSRPKAWHPSCQTGRTISFEKMLVNTYSIDCAFCLAAPAPQLPCWAPDLFRASLDKMGRSNSFGIKFIPLLWGTIQM